MLSAVHNNLCRGKPLKLAERIIRSDTDNDAIGPKQVVRPKQYGGYSPEQMDKAVSAVVQNLMSVRAAAELYGIPKSTLSDRVSGRVLPGTASGAVRYLSDSEEEELAEFIVGCASIGYPKTVRDILAVVQSILASRGVHRIVTYGWWEAYRRRHPALTLRVPSSLSKARALASTRDVIDRYFDLLEETLLENELKDCPCQIFNMDESGMPLDPKSMKTIHVRGDPKPVTTTSGNKAQITVVACVSASGNYIPPMIIWDRKTLKQEWTTGEVAGTLYGMSSKGWMDMSLFEKWFTRHFLRYAPSVRPLLLLLDGHSSHYSPVAVKMAAEENIILFTLPPNTTHLSQPLDKGVFGPLKVAWRRVCHTYLSENPGVVITRRVFSQLLNSAWQDSMTSKNIIAGFRTTGVYPTDRYAITLPGEMKMGKESSHKTRLSFIPFYTPKKSATSECHKRDPLSSSEEDSNTPLRPNPSLGKFLHYPSAAAPLTKHVKPDVCTATVLTSLENLKLLEEKQRAKEEKERAKEEKRKARKEKQIAKQREKEEKKLAAEKRQRSVNKKNKKRFVKQQQKSDISIEDSSQEELDASETPYSDIDFSSDLDFDDLGKSSYPELAADLDLGSFLYSDHEATGNPLDECSPAAPATKADTEPTIVAPVKQRSRKKSTEAESTSTLRSQTTLRVLRSRTVKVGNEAISAKKQCSPTSTISTTSTSKNDGKPAETIHAPPPQMTEYSTRVLRSRKIDNIIIGSKDMGNSAPQRQSSPSSSSQSSKRDCLRQKQVKQKAMKGQQKTEASGTEGVIDLTGEAPEVEIKYWVKELLLYESDYQVLHDGSELNDNIIVAGQSLLAKQFPHINGFQDTILSNGLKFQPVKKDGVQILHTGSTKHWICTSSIGCGRQHHVNILDSLGYFMGPLNLATLLQIAKIYSVPIGERHLRVKKLSVQQQHGTSDCGLFALAFATEICSGGDPQAACFNQKKMRRHLSMCLTKGVMKPFPKGTSEPFPRPTERLSTYRVYCHCRLLEEFDHKMVECTRCKSWYHVTCVGLCQKIPIHWKCDKCSNK